MKLDNKTLLIGFCVIVFLYFIYTKNPNFLKEGMSETVLFLNGDGTKENTNLIDISTLTPEQLATARINFINILPGKKLADVKPIADKLGLYFSTIPRGQLGDEAYYLNKTRVNISVSGPENIIVSDPKPFIL